MSREFEDIEIVITKEMFDEWNAVVYKQSIELVLECLNKNNLDKDDIQKVLLVGGTSMIPGLKEELKEFFGSKIDNSLLDIDSLFFNDCILKVR